MVETQLKGFVHSDCWQLGQHFMPKSRKNEPLISSENLILGKARRKEERKKKKERRESEKGMKIDIYQNGDCRVDKDRIETERVKVERKIYKKEYL